MFFLTFVPGKNAPNAPPFDIENTPSVLQSPAAGVEGSVPEPVRLAAAGLGTTVLERDCRMDHPIDLHILRC